MKKLLYIIPIILISYACNQTNQSTELSQYSKDSIEEVSRHMVDSIISKADHDSWHDEYIRSKKNNPVQILSARFTQEEYSNYKNVRLSYKNVSQKIIKAIRFRWHGLNDFGDNADMSNGFNDGTGGGFTDDRLKPGRTDYGTWDILSRDGDKIDAAWAYEVVFTDGTKWKLK